MDYEDVPAPAPVIPGLAWPGAVSLLVAGPKWGKTTLLAHGCAAALGGQPFIGETGEKLTGPILYYSEMPVPMLRSWIGRHVGAARPPLYAGRVAHLAAMQGDAARYRPGIIIVDSFVEALKRWDPRSDEWKAGDVRLWFASLRELAGRAGVIVTQHTRKSDGQGRDSGDVYAAVDMVITLADAGGRKSFEPPASSDTGRTLTYRGRWNEADRTVEMDPDTCAYRVVESVGGDPFSQPLDRDAAAVEATVRWLQEHPDVRTWKAFRETPKADRPAGLPGKGDRMSSIYNRARQALDQGCSPCSPDLGNSGEQGNAGRR